MTLMMNMGRDGLTAQQRNDVFRRQMLIERDRLEMMHANLQIIAPDVQDDIAKALALRLDAGEPSRCFSRSNCILARVPTRPATQNLEIAATLPSYPSGGPPTA